jgi:hypothetical protein
VKRSVVIHPFLFAAFPVLFLFAHNLHLFHVGAIVSSLLLLVGLALVLWIALTLALKSGQKAGLLISVFLVLLFSYENLFEIVRDLVARMDSLVGLFIRLGIDQARLHGFLLAVWVVIFGLAAYLLIRTRRDLHNLNLVANVMGCALVVMTLFDIAAYDVSIGSEWRRTEAAEPGDVTPAQAAVSETLPDIYYIILDGYARADVLRGLYQHDNAEFIEYLSSKGFFVASESRSNYGQTFLSLASSLNMTYLDDLASRVGPDSRSRRPAVNMIWYSEVVQYLKRLGYTTVAFSTGWWGTEITQADVYLSPRWQPDFFQRELIGMTPLSFLAGRLGAQDQQGAHRERILYAFDRLPDVSALGPPVFVFAHIIAPHPPFVFGRQGEEIGSGSRFTLMDGEQIIDEGTLTREEYAARYRDQLTFINSRVREAVEAILSDASRPAVIILQADHGPALLLDWESAENTNLWERFSILNAYYLSGGDGAQLYDSITPVNTFRVIFNHYFGTDLELLEDQSYFSTYDRPWAFTNVTEQIDNTREVGLPQ